MRFLADESCDFAVVRLLRAHGHDVLAVGEFVQRSIDSELMDLAFAENRIVLAEDKDFGWLAFAMHLSNPGVVLLRFPPEARLTMAASVVKLVDEFGPRLEGSFVVLRPGSVRISSAPR